MKAKLVVIVKKGIGGSGWSFAGCFGKAETPACTATLT